MTGFWHIQDHPEAIAVKSPEINPNLVTLPDSGSIPAAFGGTHAAWFGEPSTGTFCGSDFSDVADNDGQAKNGCMSSTVYSGQLTSPTFSLSGVASARLDLAAWWEIESVNPSRYDVMTVDYSTDGGDSWQTAATLNPTSDPDCCSADVPYSDNGLGASPSWQDASVDLSGAANSPEVQVRITFDTGDAKYNVG
jgi:hypothetical protein